MTSHHLWVGWTLARADSTRTTRVTTTTNHDKTPACHKCTTLINRCAARAEQHPKNQSKRDKRFSPTLFPLRHRYALTTANRFHIYSGTPLSRVENTGDRERPTESRRVGETLESLRIYSKSNRTLEYIYLIIDNWIYNYKQNTVYTEFLSIGILNWTLKSLLISYVRTRDFYPQLFNRWKDRLYGISGRGTFKPLLTETRNNTAYRR